MDTFKILQLIFTYSYCSPPNDNLIRGSPDHTTVVFICHVEITDSRKIYHTLNTAFLKQVMKSLMRIYINQLERNFTLQAELKKLFLNAVKKIKNLIFLINANL